MRLAIMQPYFFPYIGYFQLINAVDNFVFYDDVNYIKNGWINRNRILINDKASYLTVSLNNASPNKLINEIEILDNRPKLGKTIQMAYRKAPFFDNAWPVVKNCLDFDSKRISEIAIFSIKAVSEYLELKTEFKISSLNYSETKGIDKAERLIEICKIENTSQYINLIGGKKLYAKEKFAANDIKLNFIKSHQIKYHQFGIEFVSGLSIIDLLMFNTPEEVRTNLEAYELE